MTAEDGKLVVGPISGWCKQPAFLGRMMHWHHFIPLNVNFGASGNRLPSLRAVMRRGYFYKLLI